MALRKDASTKSFFISPSHTFKKLVSAFPKAQKHTHHSSQPGNGHEQQKPQPKLSIECENEGNGEDDEDELNITDVDGNDRHEGESAHLPLSSGAEDEGVDVDDGVEDGTEYSSSSEGEYPRPRIHQDLLPHDFSAWQKSPSITSSTSREAETFSEVLSSSTSQDRYAPQGGLSQIRNSQVNRHREHHYNPNCMENQRNPSPNERDRNPSPTITSATASSPLVDLHLHKVRQKLPDLKLDVIAHGVSGSCRYGGPAGLKSLPEDHWSARSGVSEDGRRNSVDGTCWQRRKVLAVATGSRIRDLMQEGGTLYENLADMMPFIETYREYQDDGHPRNNFPRHASLVYTRAPSREALAKKVAETANARRVSRNVRRVKKKSDGMWEEQENQPTRVRGHDLSCSPRSFPYENENAVDIAKLQGQVEELQRKLSSTEDVLQSFQCVVEPKNEGSEMQLLMRKVEELQRKIVEKDQLLESAQETLALKENEIQALQTHLRETEDSCSGFRARSANSEEEVTALRCEVAALRWQIEVDAERERSEIRNSKDNKKATHEMQKREDEWEVGYMEAVRKMYLAALIVARLMPREECLALVRVLRVRLQCIVRIPTMSLP